MKNKLIKLANCIVTLACLALAARSHAIMKNKLLLILVCTAFPALTNSAYEITASNSGSHLFLPERPDEEIVTLPSGLTLKLFLGESNYYGTPQLIACVVNKGENPQYAGHILFMGFDEDRPRLWIDEIKVTATFRNQGIGRAMLEYIEKYTIYSLIQLYSFDTAVGFYQALNYKEEKPGSNYFLKELQKPNVFSLDSDKESQESYNGTNHQPPSKQIPCIIL